jgi:hypothetical protein
MVTLKHVGNGLLLAVNEENAMLGMVYDDPSTGLVCKAYMGPREGFVSFGRVETLGVAEALLWAFSERD